MESEIPDLGVCRLCGQPPEYNVKGHRGHAACHVLHDCPKLPGSPVVVFTVDDWLRGVSPYSTAKPIKFLNDPDWIVGKRYDEPRVECGVPLIDEVLSDGFKPSRISCTHPKFEPQTPPFTAQLRSEEDGLSFFPTLAAAFAHAETHPGVWKISFPVETGERVRLVKQNGCWVYENLLSEVLKELEIVCPGK